MKKFLVGGAVRDKLLGLQPKDLDWVIVGATAEDVALLEADGFKQVGADFPVYLHPTTGDEYALARVERKISSGYHGFEVEANANVTIQEDLARRDLTVNSMAMDEAGLLVDPFNGRNDLRNHILRHTTAAFSEDPLRVLRLARFAARFKDWKIAPETVALCNALCDSGELNSLTTERVWVELEKGFSEKSPARFMQVLNDLGALRSCNILTELFGADFMLDRDRVAVSSALRDVCIEQRLAVSIAVLASRSSALLGSSARVRECFKNLQFAHSTEKNGEALLCLLKRAKAFSDGFSFNDMVTALMTREQAGVCGTFSSKKVSLARRSAAEVRASQFNASLQGKQLGDAIEQARIECIQQTLSIPKCAEGLQQN